MCGEVDQSGVMRSPYAGDALDPGPPLWIVPNKAAALSLSESESLSGCSYGFKVLKTHGNTRFPGRRVNLILVELQVEP